MPSSTSRSAAVHLLVFAWGLVLLLAVFGCGSDDPADDDPIEVVIPVTPGEYQIYSRFIRCANTPEEADTTTVDTLRKTVCEFTITDITNTGNGRITDADVQEIDGNYTIAVEFRFEISPCLVYQIVNLQGTITDSTIYFESQTYQSRVGASDSDYQSSCVAIYADSCISTLVYDAVWQAPPDSGACD